MELRKVKRVFKAEQDDIGDLKTFRALPTRSIENLDPFLFLNHHGPQVYPRKNRGLPFGPHPHRGFETVTFILEGDLTHQDSAGHKSTIQAGGVQWMTAGKGIVHSEVSSKEFLENGGPLEILQLWLNLPSRLKMTKPAYVGLQKDKIPQIQLEQNAGTLSLISGTWKNQVGPIKPLLDVTAMVVRLNANARWSFEPPSNHELFFYVVRGEIEVNEKSVGALSLVQFETAQGEVSVTATASSVLLICHAEPLNEPIVSHGPFVMNSVEEIHQAIRDYQAGKFETF